MQHAVACQPKHLLTAVSLQYCELTLDTRWLEGHRVIALGASSYTVLIWTGRMAAVGRTRRVQCTCAENILRQVTSFIAFSGHRTWDDQESLRWMTRVCTALGMSPVLTHNTKVLWMPPFGYSTIDNVRSAACALHWPSKQAALKTTCRLITRLKTCDVKLTLRDRPRLGGRPEAQSHWQTAEHVAFVL